MKKFNIIVMSIVISLLYNASICYASQNVLVVNKNKVVSLVVTTSEIQVNSITQEPSRTEENTMSNNTETVEIDSNQTADKQATVNATEIDLGNYQQEMLVGEKQLLSITVLPTDTTDQTIAYQSSDQNVASINGMGRITAVSAGTAQITVTCGTVQNSFQLEVKKSNDVEVTDIEIGNYEGQMEVGKTQTLSATVLPSNATNTTITYTSSDSNVTTVLSTGEVKAIAKGVAVITVSAGTISKNVEITVNEVKVVTAEAIDLGEYQEKMAVGEKQLLSATVLPTNTVDQTITYQSSDEKVASINEMGRITAVSVGKVKITVKCGTTKNSFNLEVKKSNDVEVTDIEIGNYEEKMEVDKTQTISATVLPSNATNTTVKYTSSDREVATVLSTGEIKAKAKGAVTITVSAGEISKEIEITVNEATLKIDVNSTYVVLKPDDEYKLVSSAQPSSASQAITYESADKDIATVASNGTISAKSIGTTSVIVSNGDISTAVTVIVNESGISEQTVDNNSSSEIESDVTQNLSEKEAELIAKIKDANNTDIKIEVKDYKTISKNILKCLYEEKKVLIIKGNDYIIRLEGNNIINYENELITEIEFITENNGTSFIINANNNLPGAIELTFNEGSYKGKYLYIFNETKEKYQLIKNEKNSSDRIFIDTTGKYLLTDEKIAGIKIGIIIVVVLSICIIIAIIAYIAVKKKYWFW